MAGQKTLLNKAQQDFLDRFKKSRLGSRFFLYGGTAPGRVLSLPPDL